MSSTPVQLDKTNIVEYLDKLVENIKNEPVREYIPPVYWLTPNAGSKFKRLGLLEESEKYKGYWKRSETPLPEDLSKYERVLLSMFQLYGIDEYYPSEPMINTNWEELQGTCAEYRRKHATK